MTRSRNAVCTHVQRYLTALFLSSNAQPSSIGRTCELVGEPTVVLPGEAAPVGDLAPVSERGDRGLGLLRGIFPAPTPATAGEDIGFRPVGAGPSLMSLDTTPALVLGLAAPPPPAARETGRDDCLDCVETSERTISSDKVCNTCNTDAFSTASTWLMETIAEAISSKFPFSGI